MPLNTRNMNIYGLGLGISTTTRYLGNSCSRGSGTPLEPMNYLHVPFDASWHREQEYRWFRSGDLNRFQDIWVLPVRGTRYLGYSRYYYDNMCNLWEGNVRKQIIGIFPSGRGKTLSNIARSYTKKPNLT